MIEIEMLRDHERQKTSVKLQYHDTFKLCDLIARKSNISGKMSLLDLLKGSTMKKGIKFVVVVKKKNCQ